MTAEEVSLIEQGALAHKNLEDIISAQYNVVGQRFGRLVAVAKTRKYERGRTWYWECVCDCGNRTEVLRDSLTSGNTKSCGCYQRERQRETAILVGHGNRRHGDSHGNQLYYVWHGMKDRCYNKNHRYYRWYGGRGIAMCDEWRGDYSLFREWATSHGYSPSLTIDRINNDLGYSPDNCQFITKKENTTKAWRGENGERRRNHHS
jgi:hypothetical protein